MSDPYIYPGTAVLKNCLGIRDPVVLDFFERSVVTQRTTEGVPKGNFDLDHLCAIHHHLFQDVYEWAGEIRSVELSKGKSQFQLSAYITKGIEDVHRRLQAERFLRHYNSSTFTSKAAEIIGDLNYIHPFREGNGRTQFAYLKQLSEHAGHEIDLQSIRRAEWIRASIAAHAADYAPMAQCIEEGLAQSLHQGQSY